MKTITVYCASSSKINPLYVDSAKTLGTLMASRDMACINGGGNSGLMGAVSSAILESGGKVIGVIPQFMVDEGWFHPALSEMVVTDSMHTRKQTMANRSDGCIALPGGIGTLEELLEIITWKQLGLYDKPVIILNVNGYYDDLLQMLDKAVRENFMREQHRKIYQVATSPEEALNLLEELAEWCENPRAIAAI